MRYVVVNGVRYAVRHNGQRVAVVSSPEETTKTATRKRFKADWVKLPRSWYEALRQADSAGKTYELAHAILFEAFKRSRSDGEIILSAEMTGMSRTTRRKAAGKTRTNQAASG